MSAPSWAAGAANTLPRCRHRVDRLPEAHVLVSKFFDHLPLYRQSVILRSTTYAARGMCNFPMPMMYNLVPRGAFSRGLNRVLRNSYVRFLGGWTRATASDYPTTRSAHRHLDARTGCLPDRYASVNGRRLKRAAAT